ncbi:MAG: chitobiase/beta-hexosaminidase C-terminal domain-containing protein [Prevotella sp.]|nr:chitobiase/beta-hexosaminidase C-terminal domain-containing protein [Prevotella sp.]
MKQNLRLFMLTLLCAVFSSAWGQTTIASGTFNGKGEQYTAGWTTTGTGKGRTDCIVIGSGENITSPAINLAGYDKISITFTGRRYGSLSGGKATVDVSIGNTSVGTIDITKTSVAAVDGAIEFEPTSDMTEAILVFTCTNATSAGSTHGAGIGSITITGINESSVPTPIFSVAEGVYTEAQTVAITCEDEDADIYYTLDGSTPTSESTLYESAITISETTTLKAIAIKDGVSSLLASATYTIETPITIAVAREKSAGSEVLTKGVVTSIYNRTVYIQDATAAICFYRNTSDLTPNVGDEILVKGKLKDQNGLLEIIDATSVQVLSQNNTVTPELMTIAEVNASTNQGWFIKIEEATVTAKDGQNVTIAQGNDNVIVRFNKTSDISFEVNYIVTLTGNIGCYNTLQIANPTIIEVIENVEPTITVDPTGINVSAEGGNGMIEITYDNFDETPEFAVEFYNAAGGTTTYDWVTATINSDNMLSYSIDANEGEARTAYLKVYANDSESGDDIFSELITFNQEAYVAPEEESDWVLTDLADLTEDDVFVIVGNNGATYAMSNDKGASSQPVVVAVTIKNDKITSEVANNIRWNISGDATDGYTFYPDGNANTWLYCTNSNNGVRVGTNANKVFTVEGGYLKNTATSRYVGIYNSADWRCYTSYTGSNIANQTFAYYKKVAKEDLGPTITVNPDGINLNANANEGTIEITYDGFDETPVFAVEFYNEDGETTTYDWVTATINSDNILSYSVAANTGEARTAYLKVYANDSESGDDIFSELITINQEAYVAPSDEEWVLTTLDELTENDVFVIVGTNANGSYAMSNDNGTGKAPTAVAVTISSDGQNLTSVVEDNIKWNISVDATNGYTFYPDGNANAWLYSTNSNNGVRVGTGAAKHFTLSTQGYLTIDETEEPRFIGIYNSSDWRSYTSINANIKDQSFAFYKKVFEPEEIEVTFAKRAEGYSTLYYGTTAINIPAGVKAYTYKVDDNGKAVETEYENIIPKGSAVVVELVDKSLVADGNYTISFTTAAIAGTAHADNMLNGFDEGGETVGPDSEKDYYFYKLSLNKAGEEGSIGFYWNNSEGSAFTMPAHRAYLAVEKEIANGVSAFTFDGIGTGINGIFANGLPTDGIYTLTGVRVNSDRLQKGIYIVNGKKVVIK